MKTRFSLTLEQHFKSILGVHSVFFLFSFKKVWKKKNPQIKKRYFQELHFKDLIQKICKFYQSCPTVHRALDSISEHLQSNNIIWDYKGQKLKLSQIYIIQGPDQERDMSAPKVSNKMLALADRLWKGEKRGSSHKCFSSTT